MPPPLNYNGLPKETNCECCSPRLMTATATTGGHKWTKEEILNEIIHTAREVGRAGFFTRGEVLRRLKHWVEKLDRLRSAEAEFLIKPRDP